MKQAIPTDFRGVRFRSKSEAMLAATLESQGREWRYEPSEFSTGDYQPDFFVDEKIIVEYKPDFVSDAYLLRLAQKFTEIENATGRSCELWVFNFFVEDIFDLRGKPNGVFTLFEGRLLYISEFLGNIC